MDQVLRDPSGVGFIDISPEASRLSRLQSTMFFGSDIFRLAAMLAFVGVIFFLLQRPVASLYFEWYQFLSEKYTNVAPRPYPNVSERSGIWGGALAVGSTVLLMCALIISYHAIDPGKLRQRLCILASFATVLLASYLLFLVITGSFSRTLDWLAIVIAASYFAYRSIMVLDACRLVHVVPARSKKLIEEVNVSFGALSDAAMGIGLMVLSLPLSTLYHFLPRSEDANFDAVDFDGPGSALLRRALRKATKISPSPVASDSTTLFLRPFQEDQSLATVKNYFGLGRSIFNKD